MPLEINPNCALHNIQIDLIMDFKIALCWYIPTPYLNLRLKKYHGYLYHL
jgi:hypothetical protein